MKKFLAILVFSLSVGITCAENGSATAMQQSAYAAVDLGLSVKWANMNVGATAPYEYGLYFAWGETKGYGSDTSDGHNFNWSSYKWCDGSYTAITKYKKDEREYLLDADDDAATVNFELEKIINNIEHGLSKYNITSIMKEKTYEMMSSVEKNKKKANVDLTVFTLMHYSNWK